MELTKLSATSQGRFEDAAPMYDRVLTILEKVHGTDHPLVAGTLNNQARLLKKMVK